MKLKFDKLVPPYSAKYEEHPISTRSTGAFPHALFYREVETNGSIYFKDIWSNLHLRPPCKVTTPHKRPPIQTPKFSSEATTVAPSRKKYTPCKRPRPLFWMTAFEFSIVFIVL